MYKEVKAYMCTSLENTVYKIYAERDEFLVNEQNLLECMDRYCDCSKFIVYFRGSVLLELNFGEVKTSTDIHLLTILHNHRISDKRTQPSNHLKFYRVDYRLFNKIQSYLVCASSKNEAGDDFKNWFSFNPIAIELVA